MNYKIEVEVVNAPKPPGMTHQFAMSLRPAFRGDEG
jgi:hypothetical protein